MLRPSLLVGAFVASALPTLAQTVHNQGFTYNVMPGATTRGAMAANAGELMFRVDWEEYRGLDGTINGLQFIMQDQDVVATPGQPYQLYLYSEDPANPDFPNFAPGTTPGTTALGGAVGLTGPTVVSPNSTVVGAALITVTFATPITTNLTTDLFVSFNLPADPLWPNDGLSVQISLGINPNFPPPATNVFDLKGAAPVAQNSYGLVHNLATSAFSYGGARQGMVDLMVDQASCVGTAITNQPTYTLSNASPGTASFFSGLHPDGASPPVTGGRVDDIGLLYMDPNLPAGSPVVFVADFNFLPVALPLSNFVPGSSGVACLTPALQTLTLGFAAAGTITAQNLINLPAASRPFLVGVQVTFSAIGFNATAGTLRGGSCVKQVF